MAGPHGRAGSTTARLPAGRAARAHHGAGPRRAHADAPRPERPHHRGAGASAFARGVTRGTAPSRPEGRPRGGVVRLRGSLGAPVLHLRRLTGNYSLAVSFGAEDNRAIGGRGAGTTDGGSSCDHGSAADGV